MWRGGKKVLVVRVDPEGSVGCRMTTLSALKMFAFPEREDIQQGCNTSSSCRTSLRRWDSPPPSLSVWPEGPGSTIKTWSVCVRQAPPPRLLSGQSETPRFGEERSIIRRFIKLSSVVFLGYQKYIRPVTNKTIQHPRTQVCVSRKKNTTKMELLLYK